jgi:predicted nucleic acid-binding protein
MPASFFDSNSLIYFADRTSEKAEVIEKLLRRGGTISVQVLNEVSAVGLRKMQFSWSELHEVLRAIRALVDIVPLELATHEDGLRISERYRLSIFDSMIVASALAAECTTLWSEDMQHGLVVDRRLTIRNPFRAHVR